MGPHAQGWWYLRQGRFTDEQRRWILGDNVRNDWSKVIQIQENALGMPESLQGAAHYCDIQDSIFHTNEHSYPAHSESGGEGSWEDGYWNIYAAYKDTYECLEQLVAAVAEDEAQEEWDEYGTYYDAEDGGEGPR